MVRNDVVAQLQVWRHQTERGVEVRSISWSPRTFVPITIQIETLRVSRLALLNPSFWTCNDICHNGSSQLQSLIEIRKTTTTSPTPTHDPKPLIHFNSFYKTEYAANPELERALALSPSHKMLRVKAV